MVDDSFTSLSDETLWSVNSLQMMVDMRENACVRIVEEKVSIEKWPFLSLDSSIINLFWGLKFFQVDTIGAQITRALFVLAKETV